MLGLSISPALSTLPTPRPPPPRYTPPVRVTRSDISLAARLCALAGLALCAAGCTRPLLSPTDQRSPFDRYDAIRSQFAPQALENEFGARVPNVRERLRPKE